MTLRCKPGDMARMIKAFFPENVGLIVEVVSADKDYGDGLGFSWLCKPAWPSRALNRDGRQVFDAVECEIPDAWLVPIRPPETPVTETRDHEVTA